MEAPIKNEDRTSFSILNRIPRQYFFCFFGALLWGLFAHGMTLFNKYSLYEDPSQLYGVGATYISGRWMLDILHRLETFFLGGSFSLPLVNGLSTIVYLSLSACLLIWVLSVKKSVVCAAIGGIMVTTPSIAGTFGYMFTAPHYALGTLLAVLGAALICKCRKWYFFICGPVLIACAVGIYQATIPIALCVLLLSFIQQIYADNGFHLKKHLIAAVRMLAACAIFIVVYFCANKIYLHLMQAELLSYQGIDTMGQLSISIYLQRVLVAYKQFFLPETTSSAFMYPNGMRFIYWGILGITAFLCFRILIQSAVEKPGKAVLLGIALLMLPLAVNFIFVMTDPNNVHSLMVYSHVMLIVFTLWLVDTLTQDVFKFIKFSCTVACTLSLLLCALYVRFDNICYLKAELVQQQTISYCTTLVTQIKSTEGYTDGMPVAYVKMQEKEDSSVKNNTALDSVNIIPYMDTDAMINNFTVHTFIENWCGFAPQMSYASFADHPEFQKMPCYPDKGSIRLIDGIIVVKCK